LASVGAVIVVVGCAAAPPPPPPAPPPEPEARAAPPPAAESEIGGMRESEVVATFEALGPAIAGCVEDGAKRVRELGGHFHVALRVDRQGQARWAYLRESSLGDRVTERCILDHVRRAKWPAPVGGEGLASRSFDIDPSRSPVAWEEDRVRKSIDKAAKAFAQCKKGAPGSFVATAYVRPDGRVAAAGVAPPDPDREPIADCLADAIERLRFGSPGRRAAKVTFEVP
jgi:hypothetical protein